MIAPQPTQGSRFIPTPVGNTAGDPEGDLRPPVHPHARGEHARFTPGTTVRTGSSPRPWGTHEYQQTPRLAPRFIPTPVGNTTRDRRRDPPLAVHPHARGEHLLCVSMLLEIDGSSPRPWGTLDVREWHGVGLRFIPTPVGNTTITATGAGQVTVHPHARGEHGVRAGRVRELNGSSPRPWGTRRQKNDDLNSARFIPTPVGNTPAEPSARRCSSVHPHARGEHPEEIKAQFPDAGSSPRPWGTPERTVSGADRQRFIPTPVGNTASRRSAPSSVPVHPHARGEHSSAGSWWPWWAGSSPRPWGTRPRIQKLAQQQRFIPTPVGNTLRTATATARSTVHPHARGEH